MSRIFNFSAGPAMLPEPVLEQSRNELLDWRGCGMSVLEMSHRGKEFISILEKTEADLRELAEIPDDYRVLFLQGGATQQFAMVPLNLSADGQRVDYVDTGVWSKKAIDEAGKFCAVRVVASTEDEGYCRVPEPGEITTSDDAAYLHITGNNTIYGSEFHYVPDTGDVPLVCDASSHLLSRPMDIKKFGLIYAGAQKNIGPAGMTLVIVKESLLGQARKNIPSMLDYQLHAKNDSCYNTPACFSIYMAGLVVRHWLDLGGLAAVAKANREKADLLYARIDRGDFYSNPVRPGSRSLMNVPFTLPNPELDKIFLQGAEKIGLSGLKGHRSVGGMRASIYNAMPRQGVEALVEYMAEFERSNG